MRGVIRGGWVALLAALGLGFGLAGAPAEAGAFEIGIELGPQRTGDFGTMTLSEVGGNVVFTIVLNATTPSDDPVLGSHATLDVLYFNLPSGFDLDDGDVVDLLCGGSPSCTADVGDGSPVRGGAAADFDYSIEFDADEGPIQVVSFALRDVSLAAVLDAAMNDPSSTGRGLEVAFALHVTGGGPGAGRGSAAATIGVDPSVVPEPTTGLLLGLGLAGIAVVGRRGRG